MQRIIRIIRLILILCIWSPNACRSRNGEILTQTILSDIRNAFKAVTNDSHRLNQIIPEMYAPMMQLINPTFVFQLPCAASNDDHPTTVMLAMERDDFAEPTFPNLTTQYMTEMQKRRQQQLHYAESVRPGSTKGSESDSGDAAGTSDWSVLGLHGWTGKITLPIKELEMNHKTGGKYGEKDDAYPTSKIFMDFTKGEIDAFINDIDTTENGAYEKDDHDQQAAVAVLKENNENVYIARVNDPFGYSTKWSLRNSTQITSQQPTDYATVMPTMDERPKRDVAKLYSMIKCSTSCEPLAYKGYGCYCGFSGAGVPVDGIDRCCKLHDKCYEYSNCISYLEYFVPYVWKCFRGKPLCAIDHGEWGGPESCAARLCRCDLRLSRCLRQYTCPQRRAVCTSSFARRLQHLLLYK